MPLFYKKLGRGGIPAMLADITMTHPLLTVNQISHFSSNKSSHSSPQAPQNTHTHTQTFMVLITWLDCFGHAHPYMHAHTRARPHPPKPPPHHTTHTPPHSLLWKYVEQLFQVTARQTCSNHVMNVFQMQAHTHTPSEECVKTCVSL